MARSLRDELDRTQEALGLEPEGTLAAVEGAGVPEGSPEPATSGQEAAQAPEATQALIDPNRPPEAPPTGLEPWGTGGPMRDPHLARLERIAVLVSKAVTLPDDLKGKPGSVLLLLLTGEELGIPPTEALRHVHVIKGRAALSAQLKAKLARKAGHRWSIADHDEKGCTLVTTCCPNDPPTEATFTIEDAKTAGLLKADSGWTKYPKDMLYARAVSILIRRHCPEVEGASFYSVEEIDGSSAGGYE